MSRQTESSLAPPQGDQDFIDNRLFRGLDPSLVGKLAAIPETETFGSGDVIFEEGEAGADLYLLAMGSVRISKRGAAGRQQTLATLGAGDYFGEMALLDPAPRSARATALAPTRLGRLDADGLREMLEADPLELARNLMVDAVQRLRDADALLIGEIVRAERLSLLGTMTAS
ncbi:MAG: Crp/Fnr family transcriptional regulator, partial [Longimicrobiales bacterium]